MIYDVKRPQLWISMGAKVQSTHPYPCPLQGADCIYTPAFWLAVEAASIALDMLAAEASLARTRASVAW